MQSSPALYLAITATVAPHEVFCGEMREHHYYVYMLMSSSWRALYPGVTNNLQRRLLDHRSGEFSGFTEKYQAYRLVWFERYEDIRNAIDREKQIKRRRREKKEWLIDRTNPNGAI